MKRRFLFNLVTCSMFFCLPVIGQVKEEMHRKYKTQIQWKDVAGDGGEVYEVRPGLAAAYFYDKKEKVILISIMYSEKLEDRGKRRLMSYRLAQEIVDELLPEEKKGRLCSEITAQIGSQHYNRVSHYADAKITFDIKGSPEDESKLTIDEIEIAFESGSCG